MTTIAALIFTALIIFGMLTSLWSGYYMGVYKREGKAPEIPLPHITMPAVEKKKELDKEEEKANSFYN